MRRVFPLSALRTQFVFVLALLSACTGRPGADAGIEDIGPPRDAGSDAAPDGPDVRAIDPCGPAICGPIELCGAAGDSGVGSGNGLDDDCDGQVDEDCPCNQDAMHACFPGPPDRRGVAGCHSGTALCGELGSWGQCFNAVVPTPEVCDGADNDCNGQVDEGLANCATTLQCPTHATARPLTDYTLDGRSIDPSARAFAWALECPRNIRPCPAVAAPADPMLRVHVIQSGVYTVRAGITRADGSMGECRYALYVAGSGLRVELDWEPKGGLASSSGVDMDLHVAPMDPSRADAVGWFTPDDCYYATCAAPGGRVNWGTSATDTRFAPTTDVSACSGAPPPHGDRWLASGRCWNPRLDVDDITCDPTVSDPTDPAFCFVENINVDQPPPGVTFRLMVNFFRDHGACTDATTDNDVAHPRLQVYCAGALRGEIGGIDDGQVAMPCIRNTGIGSSNWSWLAADVQFVTNACGLEDCSLRVLRTPPSSRLPACAMVTATEDVCRDAAGRVFVRRAGSRPVDADLAASF